MGKDGENHMELFYSKDVKLFEDLLGTMGKIGYPIFEVMDSLEAFAARAGFELKDTDTLTGEDELEVQKKLAGLTIEPDGFEDTATSIGEDDQNQAAQGVQGAAKSSAKV